MKGVAECVERKTNILDFPKKLPAQYAEKRLRAVIREDHGQAFFIVLMAMHGLSAKATG